jgi:hypothetical protein
MFRNLLDRHKLDPQIPDDVDGTIGTRKPYGSLPQAISFEWLIVIPRQFSHLFQSFLFDSTNPDEEKVNDPLRELAKLLLRAPRNLNFANHEKVEVYTIKV